MSHPNSAAEVSDGDPGRWAGLDEIVAPPPVQNPTESSIYRHRSLEDTRREQREDVRRRSLASAATPLHHPQPTPAKYPLYTLYTLAHLTLFSLLGTLARLGIQALSTYPNAPTAAGVLWANFAGCVVMGFLSEARGLVARAGGEEKRDGGSEGSGASAAAAVGDSNDNSNPPPPGPPTPLTIGLSTGFCGSLTSFSSFARDAFLALSNTTPPPAAPRSAFSSVLALLATVILTLSLSLSALQFGAHIAIAAAPLLPRVARLLRRMRPVLDWLGVVLGLGCWVGAVILAVFPPDRRGGPQNPLGALPEHWRRDVLFALPFAPLGTLVRFYTSLLLNPLLPSFPLGTFAVNISGSLVLAMAWDLQHTASYRPTLTACQLLQGLQDGFCGCLTTVSTWAVELRALRRRHAYVYGAASVAAALGALVGVMGGVRWAGRFRPVPVCA
ncbi:MAG: hypothetical protein M1839_000390 [Geoglossum umbratile]|nr:MAG: hypothetical protein M1839_000390 [Geoglossum umbratile]